MLELTLIRKKTILNRKLDKRNLSAPVQTFISIISNISTGWHILYANLSTVSFFLSFCLSRAGISSLAIIQIGWFKFGHQIVQDRFDTDVNRLRNVFAFEIPLSSRWMSGNRNFFSHVPFPNFSSEILTCASELRNSIENCSHGNTRSPTKIIFCSISQFKWAY